MWKLSEMTDDCDCWRFESSVNMTVQSSTKVCSFGRQVVEKLEARILTYKLYCQSCAILTLLCLCFKFFNTNRHIKTAEQRTITQLNGDWYTGYWCVGYYIWYSMKGPGRAAAPPSPLLAVPNVTAHQSTAIV